ncbi:MULTISPECIES: SH3 domain-containing C40 family peptidase [Lysinibacillus]|uniref:Peptidase n=1 Tax=Lysinibacillus fusiformis TaxID=28031 RepID=A0A2I0UY54_9BACI|nr:MULTISPECIES: SH3 domain-containing C40 family peptidase [Lysinibacillus]KUF29792.1 peptidase [Lysinibacillus sp. F5]MEE3809635.1 SH3 domain-containing C40 family peptidase [Lysinibacillus fusiformis]PKU51003.1 peptidase [Lysinibacillus fusiformis]WCH49419.1 C40 family peptidase [Lysinibacillus sp. OF-1]SCY18497.1 Cell wall-associated hydrolase, NlpC family [Lysinibacillus sp. SG9]
MKAIVTAMVANLQAKPDAASELVDEVLYGMTVDIVKEVNEAWVYVQTAYRYEGYCQKTDLLLDAAIASTWQREAQHVIRQSFADVLQQPRIQSTKRLTLVKGSFVKVMSLKDVPEEWSAIQLVSGQTGYVRTKWLQPKISVQALSEAQFRENVVETALSYLTAPYRWGGKSPLGIDCSGLCSMAYLFNGVYIFRDAKIVEGFPIVKIDQDQMQKGDLIYFPGHIALYMGDQLYIHSSLGGNEVTINSLDEKHPLFRQDLATTIVAVGTFFQEKPNI